MNTKTISAVVINAAKEEFLQKGYPKITVEDIVARAKIKREDFAECFASIEDCCLKVLKSYAQDVKREFKVFEENDNSRQRLSLFLDKFYEDAETLAKEGDPILNLYFDLRNMDNDLSKAVKDILDVRHKWIDEQFIIMLKTESAVDQGDRLMAAVNGLLLLVKLNGDAQMFKNQIIQLRSWIRSM